MKPQSVKITILNITLIPGIFALIYFSLFHFKSPNTGKNIIKGIDISHYQGNINWTKLKSENISFIYVKATEGAYTVDDKFYTNWTNSLKNNYKTGAYHFYIPNRSGKDQADMFISTVPKNVKTLPPVIDLEFDQINKSGKSKKQIVEEINHFLVKIEKYYNKRPLIYTNMRFYNYYLKDDFDRYKIWIRDTKKPTLERKRWVIWQYTEHGRARGIKGYVDMNIIYGSINDLYSN